MSQHLLAADRLAHGAGSPLLHQGYPLGPHSIVVALNKGLGVDLVQGFTGLTVAVAILASLTALAAFANLSPLRRTAGALAVGLTYMVASYFAQGSFKETIQALYVLAFALALREATRNPTGANSPCAYPCSPNSGRQRLRLQLPGPHLAVGAAAIWLLRSSPEPSGSSASGGARGRTDPACPPAGPRRAAPQPGARFWRSLFVVLVAPELGRMIDFHSFETFDPNGPGLGNLFGQVSPFEALGIWPSGDFRLAPGDGAVPAFGYYLGAAFACVCSPTALARCRRRRETAVLSGFAAAASPMRPPGSEALPTPPPRRSRSRTALRSRHRPAPAAPVQRRRRACRGGCTRSPRGGCLLAARLRQRPSRPALVLAGATGLRP